MKLFLFFYFFLFTFYSLLFSATDYPFFLTEVENMSGYVHFGTSGWDGNWYIGSNTGWYVEYSSIPARDSYKRAFLGVKLGRSKTRDKEGAKSVWEKEPIPGEIYVGINSTPTWDSSHSFLLTNVRELPKEGHPEMPLDGVGESRWFFTEIPISLISAEEFNYVAVWSTTSALDSAANSPIMASAIGGKKDRFKTYIDNAVKCAPPSAADPDVKMISFYETSLCIKLVPENTEMPSVKIIDLEKGDIETDSVIKASVTGRDVYRAWLEMSSDGKTFSKTGFFEYSAPYTFPVPFSEMQPGKTHFRVGVSNIYENTGYSPEIILEKF